MIHENHLKEILQTKNMNNLFYMNAPKLNRGVGTHNCIQEQYQL